MLEVPIFILRKLVRIGAPVGAGALSLFLFSWWLESYDFLKPAFVFKVFAMLGLCAFVGVFVIILSSTWNKYSGDRYEIKQSIKEVKAHVRNKRERKLLEAKGRPGLDDPTIYESKDSEYQIK